MNANELADELEIAQGNNTAEELISEAIATLRQKQAEIEALKEQIKENDVCLKILMQRLDDGN